MGNPDWEQTHGGERMTDMAGVEGFAICSNDCDNMYPRGEANNGEDVCPECRGEDREPTRVEEDSVTGYHAKVWSKYE